VSRRLIALLATAGALVAPAAAQAAATPEYAVEVTGIHVVDWELRTADYPQECKGWTHGQGTQTLGVRTTKAARYMLLTIPGSGPMFSMSKAGKYAGHAQRELQKWQDHGVPQTRACTPCGPLSEYGECDEDASGDLLAPLFDCKARTAPGTAVVSLALAGQPTGEGSAVALADSVRVATSVGATFTHCPPTQNGGPGLKAEQPTEVSIVGAQVKRLLRLRPGQKLTLKGSEERGTAAGQESQSCSKPAGTVGYSECAVTEITVEIRRLK
jgi:uncharacterized protein (DUF2141 family)